MNRLYKSPPPSKKCPKKLTLALSGDALTNFPRKLSLKILFLRPGGAGAPTAPPGYACAGHGLSYMMSVCVVGT